MKIIASTPVKFVPRNMAKLLESINDSVTQIKVDAAIFATNNHVWIDDEEIIIVDEASSGEGWVIYNVTRGGSPTIHVGDPETGANVLGPSPVELISQAFGGATEFSGIFISGPNDGHFCYEKNSTRRFYFVKLWGNPNITIPWPPYDNETETVRILAWSHVPGSFSIALF